MLEFRVFLARPLLPGLPWRKWAEGEDDKECRCRDCGNRPPRAAVGRVERAMEIALGLAGHGPVVAGGVKVRRGPPKGQRRQKGLVARIVVRPEIVVRQD